MTNKNPHEDSSCPVEQDVLEESLGIQMDQKDDQGGHTNLIAFVGVLNGRDTFSVYTLWMTTTTAS